MDDGKLHTGKRGVVYTHASSKQILHELFREQHFLCGLDLGAKHDGQAVVVDENGHRRRRVQDPKGRQRFEA